MSARFSSWACSSAGGQPSRCTTYQSPGGASAAGPRSGACGLLRRRSSSPDTNSAQMRVPCSVSSMPHSWASAETMTRPRPVIPSRSSSRSRSRSSSPSSRSRPGAGCSGTVARDAIDAAVVAPPSSTASRTPPVSCWSATSKNGLPLCRVALVDSSETHRPTSSTSSSRPQLPERLVDEAAGGGHARGVRHQAHPELPCPRLVQCPHAGIIGTAGPPGADIGPCLADWRP